MSIDQREPTTPPGPHGPLRQAAAVGTTGTSATSKVKLLGGFVAAMLSIGYIHPDSVRGTTEKEAVVSAVYGTLGLMVVFVWLRWGIRPALRTILAGRRLTPFQALAPSVSTGRMLVRRLGPWLLLFVVIAALFVFGSAWQHCRSTSWTC